MTKNPHLSSYLWNESQRVSIKETDRYFIRESYKYLLQECLPFTLNLLVTIRIKHLAKCIYHTTREVPVLQYEKTRTGYYDH